MLLLLLGIFLVLAIGLSVASCRVRSLDAEEILTSISIVCFILAGICLLSTIFVGIDYKGSETVDARIELYEAENQKIETTIATIASEYKEFEKETYEAMLENPEIVLVIPELKSDTIVQEQIKVYKENKAKIIALKEEKLNRDILRWWLFF